MIPRRGGWTLYDVYKLRLGTGAIFALPLVLAVLWYAWSAFAAFDRYRRAEGSGAKLDAEMFQLSLHDELMRDLRRMRVDPRPSTSRMPVYELSLTRANLDALNAKPDTYVPGLIKKDGNVREIGVRYRGGQPWSWLGPQKSLKVRLQRGELLDGARTFNLLNDPTPFGLEQEIILGIAKDLELLTPEYHSAWVRVNNFDLGVYRYEAQPDEGLLRRGRRMPGSMYSGDTDTGALFSGREGWKKVAWGSEDLKEDYAELDRLLEALNRGTHRRFKEYAEKEIDLLRYAKFDALDVVFGANDHDCNSNHKLYVDPYANKIEPIAWAFRGFHHEERFHLVENPLSIRLELVPGYAALRDRWVYALLTGKASLPEVRTRAEREFAAMSAELDSDPYWDAYKLLPRASRFLRFMVRPMSRDRWVLSAEEELDDLAKRSRWLLDQLEAVEIKARRVDESAFELLVRGHSAYRFVRMIAEAGCNGDFELWADVDRDDVWDPSRDARIASGPFHSDVTPSTYADLFPGTLLIAHEDPKPNVGKVRTTTEPRSYVYFVKSSKCRPEKLSVFLESAITGASLRLDLDQPSTDLRVATTAANPDEIPQLAAGDRSPHPWSFPPSPLPEVVHLGPGVVTFLESKEFGAHQRVEIAPGTRIELGPDASLSFSGPLFALGDRRRPITIARSDDGRPFGGIAIVGPATAGSRLHHFEIRGGSGDQLDVFHTRDIEITDALIDTATRSADLIHANFVDDLRLQDVVVRNAPTDAVDLEFTTADVRGLDVVDAGDDCLDLMGSHVRLIDSVLLGCTNNGISAGEETEIVVHGGSIAESKIGVLAKNASNVRITRSVVYKSEIALQAKLREIHYDGESTIVANELTVVECDQVFETARGTKIEPGRVHRTLPDSNDLDRRLLELRGGAR